MDELNVRSVDSLVDSQFDNFSRETLISLLKLHARLYMLLDGHWYLAVKERFGNEQAVEIDLEVWDKQGPREVEEIARLIGYQSRDVASLIELSAIMPSAMGSRGYVEMRNRNECILHTTYCPIVNTLIKEGKGREKTQCDVICRRLMTTMATSFNPDIETKALKIPPHQDHGDTYCEWQFTLKES